MDGYSNCKDSAEVIEFQNEYLKQAETEKEKKKSDTCDKYMDHEKFNSNTLSDHNSESDSNIDINDMFRYV